MKKVFECLGVVLTGWLLGVVVVCLMLMALETLTSCSPLISRPLQTADSAHVAPRRLLGLLPPRPAPTLFTVAAQANALPPMRFGKKSTIILQTGSGNSASTEAGRQTKLKGGSQLATDSSTLNVAGPGGNLATLQGNDNVLDQKAALPSQPPPWWKWVLAGLITGFAAGGLVTNRLLRGRWFI